MPKDGARRRILLVEDEPATAASLARALERAGYATTTVATAVSALQLAAARDAFDLVLVDGALRGHDAHALCDALHERARIPVVMLADSVAEADRDAWSDGAEDYIVKPVRTDEAIARVRGVLRRIEAARDGGAALGGLLRAGPLVLDTVERRARLFGRDLKLSPKELDLLARLMRDAGRVVTREDLIADVWDGDSDDSSRTLDMHVALLRRKLGDDPAHPRMLHTVRGVGFRLSSPTELTGSDSGSGVHR